MKRTLTLACLMLASAMANASPWCENVATLASAITVARDEGIPQSTLVSRAMQVASPELMVNVLATITLIYSHEAANVTPQFAYAKVYEGCMQVKPPKGSM